MSEAYNRNLAVKGVVLFEVQQAKTPILGTALVARIEEAGRRAVSRVPEYDFIGWVGGTIWELLTSCLDKGLIALDGERPFWDYQLARSTISITEHGARFIEDVRAEASEQLAYFA